MNGAVPIGSLARDLVLHCIECCEDPAERKERIMIAREQGVLTEQEATDWLAILELQAA